MKKDAGAESRRSAPVVFEGNSDASAEDLEAAAAQGDAFDLLFCLTMVIFSLKRLFVMIY